MNCGEEYLREAVKRLERSLDLVGVILFGSRARGDWLSWSDYDLLIIGVFRERYLDRIKSILDILGDIPIHIEPHPYTLDEAINMLKRGNPIIVHALEGGRILISGRGLEKLLETYWELKKRGLKMTDTTVIMPPSSKHIKE